MPSAAQSPAVVVDGLSKRFQMPAEQVHTLKERALHPFRRQRFNRFDALTDVSFTVPRGEFFGIVGRNGSGKSTLLKCLAGIYGVDVGRILVDGRLATFIELGVGFNPDLAARDNVVINGVMLGLSPAAARERFERVLEFSELQEFVDLKLKNYSSGMHVRLAFSVAVQVDADVLLIDEVLAVGDAAFQQKCFDEFHRLRDEGKTMLFVTHDMGAVVRFCDRAMLIERGRTRLIGEPEEVASQYLETNFNREHAVASAAHQGADRFGDGRAKIVRAWFEGADGEPAQTIRQGSDCVFRAHVRFTEQVVNPIFGVGFENAETPIPVHDQFDAHPRGDRDLCCRRRSGVQRPARERLRSRPDLRDAGHRERGWRRPVDRPARAFRVRGVHRVAGLRRDRQRGARLPDRAAAGRAGTRSSMTVVDRPKDVELAGPSALGNDARRFANLTWTLASTDFRLKFFGSALGYLWQLMRPLLLFGVIYLVFAEFVKLGENVPFYPVVLLSGVILFTFYSEATGAAVTSVLDREALLRKIRFPRLVIPTASVLTAVFNLGLNLVVVLIFMIASGVEPHPSWIQAPLHHRCADRARPRTRDAGLGAVRAIPRRPSDLGRRPAGDVLRDAAALPDRTRLERDGAEADHAEPARRARQQFRHAVIDPSAPSTVDILGSYALLMIPVALAVGLTVLGFVTFQRGARTMAERL